MAINNQIIGGNFTDPSGVPLANGKLVFELSQDEQSPIPGQVGASRRVAVALDSTGNVPASPAAYVWANDSLNPVNSFYRVIAYSASGQVIWGPQSQQVLSSPSPFNLSNWVPNSVNLSSAIPAPTTLFETNGTPNGSQRKFNAVAGSGLTITDDGSGDITFAAASSMGTGGQLLYAKASFSSAEILAGTQKLLVPAPGPNKMLFPLFFTAKYIFGGVGYNHTQGASNLRSDASFGGGISWAGPSQEMWNADVSTLETFYLGTTGAFSRVLNDGESAAFNTYLNTPLWIGFSNMASGNGSFKFILLYQLLDMS